MKKILGLILVMILAVGILVFAEATGVSAANGGGVYLGINGILDMTDGRISGNTALHTA